MGDTREVMAFSDCEMAEGDRINMLDRIASDGELAKQIKHQQQLKTKIARCMTEDESCKCPDVLKDKIAGMFAEAEGIGHAAGLNLTQANEGNRWSTMTGGSDIIGKIGRWAPAAVAAVFFISAAIVMYAPRSSNGLVPKGASLGGNQLVGGVIPPSMVNMFEKRHVGCSREVQTLHQDPNLPRKIEALPGALSARFNSSTNGLDLRGIGYVFDRVGQCTVPGNVGVHLIYQAEPGTGHRDAISLWIAPVTPELKVAEGKVYEISGREKAHPILMWRQGEMGYYLVGDSLEATQKAADQLRQDS